MKTKTRTVNFHEAWSLYKILKNIYSGEIKDTEFDMAFRASELLPHLQMSLLLDLIYGSHLDTIIEDMKPEQIITDMISFFIINRVKELFMFFLEITK